MKKFILALAFLNLFNYAVAQTIDPPSCSILSSTITCGGTSLTPGTGTVSSVSVTTANGISGVVATATTTPAITLTLGAITPTSIVASGTITGGAFIPTSASAPSDGMYLNSVGQTAFAAGGARIFFFNSTGLLMNNASGATLTSSAASATVPTVIPLRSDSGTGMGSSGTGNISFISGSAEKARITSVGVQVISGNQFQLGNSAVTGLVAGALAALTTSSIVIYDATGTAYRVPAITP